MPGRNEAGQQDGEWLRDNHGGYMELITIVSDILASNVQKLVEQVDRVFHDMSPTQRIEVKTGERNTVRTWL